jgi:hypothetical protein
MSNTRPQLVRTASINIDEEDAANPTNVSTPPLNLFPRRSTTTRVAAPVTESLESKLLAESVSNKLLRIKNPNKINSQTYIRHVHYVLSLVPEPTAVEIQTAISIVDRYVAGVSSNLTRIQPSNTEMEVNTAKEVPDSVMEAVDGGKSTKSRRNKRFTKKRNSRSTKKRNLKYKKRNTTKRIRGGR